MRQLMAAVCSAGLFCFSATAFALPSGFTKTRVVSGLSKPTAMAFAADGRIFVAERGTSVDGVGKIRIIKNGTLLGTPFVRINTDVSGPSPNERGLLGIAIDPDFASNKYVYVYYTVRTSPARNRVSRF